jgi:hypothetical protein
MNYTKNKLGRQFHGRSGINEEQPRTPAEIDAVKQWGKYVRLDGFIVLTKDNLANSSRFQSIH